MKTFREFILEAERRTSSDWWTKGRKEASQKLAQLRRQRGGTTEQQISTSNKIKELEKEISNNDTEHSDTRPQETERQKRQKNAVINTGYAQTGVRGRNRNPASSVGTVEGHRRRRVTDMRTGQDLGPAEPADTRTSGRYGKVTGSRKSRSGGDIGR